MSNQYLQQLVRTTVASGSYLVPISDAGSGRLLGITKDNLLGGLFTQSSGYLNLNAHSLTLSTDTTINQNLSTTSNVVFSSISGNWAGNPIPANLGGAYTLLSSASIFTAVSSVNLTIPSGYQEIYVSFAGMSPTTNAVFLIVRSSGTGGGFDNGATDYTFSAVQNATAIVTTGAQISLAGTTTYLGNAASRNVSGGLRLYNPWANNYNKITWDIAEHDSDGSIRVNKGAGARQAMAPIRAISLLMSVGNIGSGEYRVYGLANS